MLAIFLSGWLIAGLTAYTMEKRNARQDTVHTAEVLLGTAIAARSYTSEEIQPLLIDKITKDFIPQTVPSYSAQQLFARLGKKYQGYTYAERVLNPTNRQNIAKGWQVEMIQAFIKNPELKEIIGERTNMEGEDFLYVAKPIQVQQQSCLQCHGKPEVAPPSLLKTYGYYNGFDWKLNEIVGTRLISVPTLIPKKQAQKEVFSYLLMIASVFLVAYTTVSLIVQHWILRPLDAISHLVEQVSLHRVENLQLPDESFDELGKLSKSVNRLIISLQKALSNQKRSPHKKQRGDNNNRQLGANNKQQRTHDK
ncbi:DUF3365 domain-containing protein [Xenococcus sp. PCC 7305]|uniref:c-type heme family protein n=1 Tax=Xenococcus sp. PCC 7305 TaxID=102125 RepID=UPI0002F0A6B3|nr:DUF3365 domain-containing protein [Xenococcus sp. PCC 7305]